MVQATKMFSKFLTETDIKKRLAIPAKILPALPDFNGSHALEFQLMYGERMWPIVCSVRKEGYKKPVFSGGWRNFVIRNGFDDKVGYKLTLYKVQNDEPGTFHYTIEVEKPDRPSVAFSLQKHGVGKGDETSRIKVPNFEHEKEQLAKVECAPQIKEEKATMEVADFAAHWRVPFVDHVVAKPPLSIFGSNESDNIAHLKTEQTEKKLFGIPMGMGMDETHLLHACYMTKEESYIKTFDLTGSNSLAYGTSQATGEIYDKSTAGLNLELVLGQGQPTVSVETVNLTKDESYITTFDLTGSNSLTYGTSQAAGEIYYKSTAGLNLELVRGQGQPTVSAETVNYLDLDLTLSLPAMNGEAPEFAHSKPYCTS